MNARGIALQIAWAYLGRPYIWGGDDPMRGFDCSGLIIEILQSVGVIGRKVDLSAQGLWLAFKDKCKVEHPDAGCLVFWTNRYGSKVIHVEMCINRELSIGSSGGGSKTLTLKDAIEQNAYIKIRPFRSRQHIKGFIDPFNNRGESI